MKHSVSDQIPHDPPQLWFALRVKSHCEKAVVNTAQNKGFEGFVPVYKSSRRWSDRVKALELPLFPGYVFCRLNPQHRLPLLTIPGALYFAGNGKVPVPIDDAEIAAIQTAVHSGLPTEPYAFLEVGQRVRLEVGPLMGMEGILVETPNQQCLVVSVTLLKRSVAVTVERHWAKPVTQRSLALADNTSRPEAFHAIGLKERVNLC